MKRLWIGIGLLAVILIAGLWTSALLRQDQTAISDYLQKAADAALNGQWAQADQFARQAESRWQDRKNFSATLADHTVLDEIEGIFAEATVYRESRDRVAFVAICARLSKSVEALQEGHRLTWWNLL